jgi:hypothetical protein
MKRLTGPRREILQAAYDAAPDAVCGAELIRCLRRSSGAIYAGLNALEDARLLRSQLEDASPEELGRPRMRLFWITPIGIELVEAATRYGWVPAIWQAIAPS